MGALSICNIPLSVNQFKYFSGKKVSYLKIKKKTYIIIFIIILIISSFVFNIRSMGKIMQKGMNEDILIIAHRAGAYRAPENTIAALNQAIADGADIVEIDIRQLRDGTLIVMHDSNFLRTTGINRHVWEVDYLDILEYDASLPLDENYHGELIPTLEEMLICANGQIRLMIDVKISGHEKNLEERLVELLKEYHMERWSIVGSNDLTVLRHVKELEPLTETVYITRSLKPEEYFLPYIDSYSLEAKGLSKKLVERIHSLDKTVYGWTVNSVNDMMMAVSSGIDGVITDDVLLAYEYFR